MSSWTEGPWSVRDGTPEGGGQVWEVTSPHAPAVNCHEVASSWENRATAELIALAPEMAAAILEYEACDDDAEVAQKFLALAERLRRIGGDDE